jgi:hypothetical protein
MIHHYPPGVAVDAPLQPASSWVGSLCDGEWKKAVELSYQLNAALNSNGVVLVFFLKSLLND